MSVPKHPLRAHWSQPHRLQLIDRMHAVPCRTAQQHASDARAYLMLLLLVLTHRVCSVGSEHLMRDVPPASAIHMTNWSCILQHRASSKNAYTLARCTAYHRRKDASYTRSVKPQARAR